MGGAFDSFIVLAGMRTGSNFLEENLNRIDGLRCWGEAFNPSFMGHEGRCDLAGIGFAERRADPHRLLVAMRAQTDGLAGFRFFRDHDPRILARCLADPACAKIVLTRNPLDSYVSLKIARATNQWRLGRRGVAQTARIRFDPAEFRRHLDETRRFQSDIRRHLQCSGQTAFELGYDDVGALDVLNGLAAWLGAAGRLAAPARRTVVQNPDPVEDKVENPAEMAAALADLDPFGLSRVPDFEPRRGPALATWLGGARAPFLFLPVGGGPRASVARWLAALDGVPGEALARPASRKELQRWRRRHPDGRSFTVLRHPVERLHRVFCRRILVPGPDCLPAIRDCLRRDHAVPLPEAGPGPDHAAAAHRAAFVAFIRFVKDNLAGRTGLPVHADWASQLSILQGQASLAPPDFVWREAEAADQLTALAQRHGLVAPPLAAEPPPQPMPLRAIYDADLERLVRETYRRDYLMFGFANWA